MTPNTTPTKKRPYRISYFGTVGYADTLEQATAVIAADCEAFPERADKVGYQVYGYNSPSWDKYSAIALEEGFGEEWLESLNSLGALDTTTHNFEPVPNGGFQHPLQDTVHYRLRNVFTGEIINIRKATKKVTDVPEIAKATSYRISYYHPVLGVCENTAYADTLEKATEAIAADRLKHPQRDAFHYEVFGPNSDKWKGSHALVLEEEDATGWNESRSNPGAVPTTTRFGKELNFTLKLGHRARHGVNYRLRNVLTGWIVEDCDGRPATARALHAPPSVPTYTNPHDNPLLTTTTTTTTDDVWSPGSEPINDTTFTLDALRNEGKRNCAAPRHSNKMLEQCLIRELRAFVKREVVALLANAMAEPKDLS